MRPPTVRRHPPPTSRITPSSVIGERVMMRRAVLAALTSLAIGAAFGSDPTQQRFSAAPRALTFDDRVKAQEAIEHVYYRHQLGATKSFEEAVPRAVLEQKVRTYLKQSVALERIWNSPITAESLHRELDRMSR